MDTKRTEGAVSQGFLNRDFVDKIPNGLGIFSYENGKYTTIYLNDGYYAMMHVRREERSREIQEDPSLAIFEEDRALLNDEISLALRENRPLRCNLRILQGDGSYRWYNLHATVAERGENRIIWYNSYTDIDELVRAESSMEEGRRRYELAIKSARLAVWEYEIATRTLIVPEGSDSVFARERYGLAGSTLENVPECMLSMGLTDTDRENFLRLYEDIRSGREYTSADVWFRRSEHDAPVCDRISYFVVKDKSGKPVRAYGSGIDITAEKREQLGFHQAIQSILTANPEALCTFQLNLTQNKCREGHGISQFILNTLRADTVDDLFTRWGALIPDPGDQALFYAVFNRKKLITDYHTGGKNLHVDYRRVDEAGKCFWVRTYISLLNNPESGDIEGVIYSLDISREVQQNEIFNIITGKEYDLIALLHLDTNTVESVQISPDLIAEYHRSFPEVGARCTFHDMRCNGAADWVVPEERQKYLEGTEPSRICAELDRSGFYELVVRGDSAERGIVYRKLQHYYLNNQKDRVLIIDSDVTQIYLQQRKDLERAKEEAKRTQDILDYISDGVCVLVMPDAEHLLIEYSNKQMPLLLGFQNGAQSPGDATQSKEAPYFADAFSGVHPDDLPGVREAYRKGYCRERFSIPRFRLITVSGAYIWVSVDVVLREKRPDGKVFYGTYRDITKEVILQRELDEQRKTQMERTLVDTIAGLPSSSALFRIHDGRMIASESFSDEFCRMLGYTQRDNIYRDDPYSGVLPEDCRRISDFIIEHLYDSQPFHLSYQLLTKSGAYIWVTANFNTFQFENTRYLYAVYTDISELKRQEKQLREQYNAAQTYLNSVSGTYIATRRVNLTRGRIESVDGMKPLAVTRGVTDYNEYVSRLLSTVPGRRDREHCRAFYARSAMLAAFGRGERIRSLEYPYRTPDGNITWVRNTVNLTMRPGSGDVIAFSAVSDINREKIIGTIMDKLASTQYDSIGCIDAANGRIVFYSSPDGTLGGKTIIRGCDYEQEMREYCGRFVVASDRETYTASMHLSNVVRLLDAGERCSVTFSAMEGGALRVKLAEFFFVDREYRLIGLVRTDYTDMQRRQLEQEKRLRDALEKARQANAAKSDFLSRMSHDIRTPLNGIIGMTYLTRELALPEKAQENLRKIDISSKFLLSLINDILDLTKAESDKIELYPEPYPPQEFYDYMDAVFKPLCDGKNQTFMVDMHPPVSVIPLFDKLRINQVLFNLLSNAVKYTPEGGTICYRANYTDPDENGRLTAEFEIGDNGRGMSEEFQKHLFESFTQESREDTSEVRGSGLGLAIVKRLMDLMGGSVSVRSRLGAGSTFTIRMEVDSIPLAADSSPQAGERPGGRPALLAGAHVLLCEDHPLNQEIAAALLARRKVDVTVAEDGKAGVERFRKSPPDYYRAILMDIRMPVMNGYEAARAIRALDRPDAKKVPIIAMTADAFLDDVQRCLDAGMNGHIAKPIEPETLYKTLESAIR